MDDDSEGCHWEQTYSAAPVAAISESPLAILDSLFEEP